MDYTDIIAYLNGDADAKERAQMEAWIRASGENEAAYRSVKEVWTAMENDLDPPTPDIDAAWKKVYGRTLARKKNRSISLVWKRVAAVILLILMGFGGYNLLQKPDLETLAAGRNDTPTRFELNDGTIVWLNQNSKLVIPKKFSRSKRGVKLIGEGYFEVARSEEWPFVVEAGGSITRVLGTSFNIQAYPDSSSVQLFVNSGKVSFASANRSQDLLLLEKGQGAKYFKELDQVKELDDASINLMAWQTQELIYDQAAMNLVFSDLEKVFEVAFQLEREALKNCLFSGRLRTDNLKDILEILAFTFDLKFSQPAKGVYQVTGTGC